MTTGQDEPVAATNAHDPNPNEQASESAPAELPAPDVGTLEKELEEVRAQATENLDKFLRAKAEVDNVRRRAEQDVSNAHKYAVERFASEIVAVRDSLDLARAVDLSGDNREVVEKMHEGLELTLKALDDTFRRFGLTLVDPKGEKFDPNRHQAISVVESDEVTPNHVVTVVQKGYLLHERVLRPAMVVVAKAKSAGGTA
jgi:molecular chaperone GrpE